MTEALRAVVRNAFEEYDVDLLVAAHFKGQRALKRVIERAGFLFDGYSVCGFRRFDGALLDCVNYSLLREEYEAAIFPRAVSFRSISPEYFAFRRAFGAYPLAKRGHRDKMMKSPCRGGESTPRGAAHSVKNAPAEGRRGGHSFGFAGSGRQSLFLERKDEGRWK